MTNSHNLPVDFVPTSEAVLHPRSIQERGMSVPFLHPPLQGVVLRVDAAGTRREAAVPSLSDKLGRYILRWESLPEAFPFSGYDQHLWQALLDAPDLSVLTIKKISQSLLLRGCAGKALAEKTSLTLREARGKKHQLAARITQDIIRLYREKERKKGDGGTGGGGKTVRVSATEGDRFDLDAPKLEAIIGDMAEHALEFAVYDTTSPESVADLTYKITEIPNIMNDIRDLIQTDEYDRMIYKITREAQVAGFFAVKNLNNARFIFTDVLHFLKVYLKDKARLDEFLQRPHQAVDGWGGAIREIATLASISSQRDLPTIEKSLAQILRTIPVLPLVVYRDFEEDQVARRRENTSRPHVKARAY